MERSRVIIPSIIIWRNIKQQIEQKDDLDFIPRRLRSPNQQRFDPILEGDPEADKKPTVIKDIVSLWEIH